MSDIAIDQGDAGGAFNARTMLIVTAIVAILSYVASVYMYYMPRL